MSKVGFGGIFAPSQSVAFTPNSNSVVVKQTVPKKPFAKKRKTKKAKSSQPKFPGIKRLVVKRKKSNKKPKKSSVKVYV